jgi:hypothetical protein
MDGTSVTRQRFLRLSGVLGGALAAAGLGSGAAATPRHRPRPPAPRGTGGPLLEGGTFPIGAFWPPPPYQTTVERWQEMADAGFTYVHSNNYLYADGQIQQHALRIADEVGLQVLVDDDDLRWLTRNFRISDDGGDFTLTRAEAETKIQQILDRYSPTRWWSIDDGALLVDGGTGDGSIGWAADGADWTDLTLEVTLTPLPTGAGGFAQAGWAFRVQDERNAYVWLLNDADGGTLTKAVFVDGVPTVTAVPVPGVSAGTAYRVTTRLEGATITTSVDGVVVDTTTDATFAAGSVGFRQAGTESATYDDVLVTALDGTVLLAEDFSGDLSAWRQPEGGGFASFAGLHVYDEPTVEQLPALGAVLDVIRSLDPQCLPYVNHFPSFDYEAAVSELDPEVLSFDRYPILSEGEDTGFFQNWADVRAAALPEGIPVWAYVQSVGYTAHAVPTLNDLYWQVNMALAYGCTGIQYFTYWTPDPARGENFTSALIDVDGTRTPLYDAATEVNTTYLQHIGPQLLPLTSTAVQAANLATVPAGLEPYAADDEIRSVRGDAVVLGRFDGPDGRYLLVVNHARRGRAEVRLRWGSGVRTVGTFNPARQRYQDRGRDELTLRLGAGRATLVKITRR